MRHSEKTIGEERRFRASGIVVVDILQVLEGLAYVGFIAGAIFAIVELREMRRDRKTELVLRMMEAGSSPERLEYFGKVEEGKYSNAEETEEKCGRRALMAVGNWCEGLSYLVRKGLVDGETVFEISSIADAWEKMKPWVMKQRSTMDMGPRFLEHFEHIASIEQAYEAKLKRKGGWA